MVRYCVIILEVGTLAYFSHYCVFCNSTDSIRLDDVPILHHKQQGLLQSDGSLLGRSVLPEVEPT